jgi:hypothetical protein
LNSARELISTDAAEKTLVLGGTARKELTLLEGVLNRKNSTALKRNNTVGKTFELNATRAAGAGQSNKARTFHTLNKTKT